MTYNALARDYTNIKCSRALSNTTRAFALQSCVGSSLLSGPNRLVYAALGSRYTRKPRQLFQTLSFGHEVHFPSQPGPSRKTLDVMRQSGEKPAVIEYLKKPPSSERPGEVIQAMRTSSSFAPATRMDGWQDETYNPEQLHHYR
jgi:hypothetical protein